MLKELEPEGIAKLLGFYSHAGHSYGGDSQIDALELLLDEIKGLLKAADHVPSGRRYILSVGATPTATSIQAILDGSHGQKPAVLDLISELEDLIVDTQKHNYTIELHAGCYVSLDMQQLATQASPSASAGSSPHAASTSSTADIALTILAEVTSIYGRDPPEALIAAGTLALGREPCKSYKGWGVVTDWGMHLCNDPEHRSGWEVGRISQVRGFILIKNICFFLLTLTPRNTVCWPRTQLLVGQPQSCQSGRKYEFGRITLVLQARALTATWSWTRVFHLTNKIESSMFGLDAQVGSLKNLMATILTRYEPHNNLLGAKVTQIGTRTKS